MDQEAVGFGKRWLLRNRRRISILHFHYVQQFYAYENTGARLKWVFRFASNLALARLLGYRTVFTLHNLSPTYALEPRWVDHLGYWFAVTLVNSVIVHCDVAAELLAQRFGRRRSVYVVAHPNYIDVYPNIVDRDRARTQLGLSHGATVFLFFGGLRPNKGIDRLIQTFRRIPGDTLVLLIVGKRWPPEAHIAKLAEMASADNRIRLLDEFVPDDEIQTYMNAADAVVLPFASILTSGSAVLAMSFGRPVIVPRMGCVSELVTPDSGVLYNPHDPEGLGSAILRCLGLDLRSMGTCARESIESNTLRRFGTETLIAYEGSDARTLRLK